MAEGWSARHGPTLPDTWERALARRDAALAELDRLAVMGCQVNPDDDRTAAIKSLVEALRTLEFQHAEMRALEKEMAGLTAKDQDTKLFEQLERLRHQRICRQRIVLQHSVSNRTGQGLEDLQGALKALMEDKRLFPHVGMQVPLNYSMLERLAQEGRLIKAKDDQGKRCTDSPRIW